MPAPLPREVYLKDTKKVARKLLGKILVRETREGIMKGKIVETEAYYGEKDPASHAFHGQTPRSKIMWGEAGRAYVYFTYGMHFLFNVITEEKGKAGAVLIRALEPLDGINLMKEHRKTSSLKNLTNGPAKLTQAFGITKEHNGLDLTSQKDKLYIVNGGDIPKSKIISTRRIGIAAGKLRKLRFYVNRNNFVSRK